MTKPLLVTILFTLFLLFPKLVEAHIGNQSFLQINEKYTQINPTYQTKTLLNAPQDVAPELYKVKTPLHLTIDTARLPFSPLIIHQTTFRWSIYSGETFSKQETAYENGEKLTHTFSHPGTYIVELEAKIPNGIFSIIDTALINITPSNNYQYPTNKVIITIDNNGHVSLTAKSTTNPSVKHTNYLWDIGKGKIIHGQRIDMSKDDLNNLPPTGISSRAIDDQNLATDILIRQEIFTKKLNFDTLTYTKGKAQIHFGNLEITSTPQSTNPYNKYLITIASFINHLLSL